MKILVTGAKGFIGKNLVAELRNRNYHDIYEYDKDSEDELLDKYCADCDFVFNLAGINRPKEQSEFIDGNFGFITKLLDTLKKHSNYCSIMTSSSIQATYNNPYGLSKKAGEDLLLSYGEETGTDVYIYRFSNVYGKWCKPNYNSVIATFCYNIAHDLPISVNDSEAILNLIYIDDLVDELINALNGQVCKNEEGYCYVKTCTSIKLGKIVELIYSFKNSRKDLFIPDMTDEGLTKKLYSTYLSYLPTDKFCYQLDMNIDDRGSFTEIMRTSDRGQFSINIIKPNITKGNHWHNTKIEKFVVISGKGLILLRKIDTDVVITYHVNGDKLEVVDIPPGYTHNITNEGVENLVVFIWCNECYNIDKSDTYFLKV